MIHSELRLNKETKGDSYRTHEIIQMILNPVTNQKHQPCSKLLSNKGPSCGIWDHIFPLQIFCLRTQNPKFHNYSLLQDGKLVLSAQLLGSLFLSKRSNLSNYWGKSIELCHVSPLTLWHYMETWTLTTKGSDKLKESSNSQKSPSDSFQGNWGSGGEGWEFLINYRFDCHLTCVFLYMSKNLWSWIFIPFG